MRFIKNGHNIPDDLLNARDEGNVVFLCGAGVSASVKLPDFKKLSKATMDGLKFEPGSDADLAFKPWADADNPDLPDSLKVAERARPSFGLIFNILQQTYDPRPWRSPRRLRDWRAISGYPEAGRSVPRFHRQPGEILQGGRDDLRRCHPLQPKHHLIDITLDAYGYVGNGKPVIDCVIECQAVKVDKDSGIVNDARDYPNETVGDPRYPSTCCAG